MTAGAGRVFVEVTDDAESAAAARPPLANIEAWVVAALDATGVVSGDAEVAVLLADDEAIRQMNREYRGKDRPTNVLSFPAGDIAGLPGDAPAPLGDIVLCPDVIAREAAEQGKAPDDHWAHLCVHGALHLAGYDHVEDDEARAMEALEVRILAGLGIADPYAA